MAGGPAIESVEVYREVAALSGSAGDRTGWRSVGAALRRARRWGFSRGAFSGPSAPLKHGGLRPSGPSTFRKITAETFM